MDHIIVIYDTSFLLRESEPVRFERAGRSGRPGGGLAIPPVTHIIPRQVKEEIHARLDSPEHESAQRARSLCSKIMALPACEEADLAGASMPAIQEKFLGPQSERDQRLVGLALDCIAEFPSAAVYVATHDGGILAELSHHRSKAGASVFTASTRPQLDELLSAHEAEERARSERERESRSAAAKRATMKSVVFRAAIGALIGAGLGYYFLQQRRGDTLFTLLAGGLGGAVVGGWLAAQLGRD
ncbi:MAG: hypothetical protein FJ386_13685 [Verrucomicrobia bacterium]|nr:hypothetical protein [Verrucomicrobiota bacterium]